MALNILVMYYPVIFVLFFFGAIGLLTLKFMFPGKKDKFGDDSTKKIDALMRNRNSGIPTSCVVDSLIAENIEYCGVEERA